MERTNYYNKNIKFNRKALKEVWEILNEYEDGINEIPEKYLWVIEDNMDKDYVFIVDDLETANIREDTKKIITYLYTNFLSMPEEREVLKKLELVQYKEKINKEHQKQQEINSQAFDKNVLEEKIEINQENNEEIKELKF